MPGFFRLNKRVCSEPMGEGAGPRNPKVGWPICRRASLGTMGATNERGDSATPKIQEASADCRVRDICKKSSVLVECIWD